MPGPNSLPLFSRACPNGYTSTVSMTTEILIDESVYWLDKKTARTMVCAVEFVDGNMGPKLVNLKNELEADTIRFAEKGKVHYSSLSEHQRAMLIDKIAKLPFVARIYVEYVQGQHNVPPSESDCKKSLMLRAVNNLARLHSGKPYLIKIEHANEYMVSRLQRYLVKESFEFILPDTIMGAFSNYLNSTEARGASFRLYQLIKEKIRSQYFRSSSMDEYLTRSTRL